jgi:predicted dienelactone hydrolase
MKKLILTLFIGIYILSDLSAQFQIGSRQITFTDASRSNRSIAAEIRYPAQVAGANAAIASGQFPIIVFGHGFVMTFSAYDVVWQALVPSGYIVVLPTTEGSLSPSHSNFGQDIAFLVNAMKAEGNNASSPFYNAVGSTSAVMGHSMGGGAAFLAASYDSTFTAIATLAAANTNPSSISAARSVRIPALVIAGGDDCVTPPADHQIPMYDSLASLCKTYVSINGGSHCQFGSNNFNCNFGEGTCNPVPAISRAAQQATTFSILRPWLDYQLKNSASAGQQFQNLLLAGSGISSNQNCPIVSSVDNSLENTFDFYPNPAKSQIRINLPEGENSLRILSLTGIEYYHSKSINSQQFDQDISDLAAGIYIIELINNGTRISKKLIVE